ncbi:MAG: serine/threonine-protein kinase [Acidobacteriota bacterium]|nr:serine/threonine-protein kinase [Acidobacteriota bacterium]
MALTPGTRLGPYEVIALLGEGGMGQVWRARDTQLDRDVALKLLPDAFISDPERLARFQREAKTLAALNHPNIAQIYGLERTDGQQALVMELVEGDDLSQRIARGPLPLDEALTIATQIAEALEAAHEQGIIHRDLKPANIKVRADGTVKVLDFGLAKAIEPTASSPDVTQSPTITSPAQTMQGVILGTAAYMSPEQARGKPVDKRTDIWAFGCVLYEMLTGRRAFGGDDVSETLARVIEREPDFDALPATTPTPIRRLLRRCLERDRRKRQSDAADARLDIGDALVAFAVVTATTSTRPAAHRWLPWTVAGVLAATLFAALLGWAPWRSVRVPQETRTDIVTPDTADPASFSLSPDGRQIVFVASDEGGAQLWLRSLNSTTAETLPGTEGATSPFWSPDGRAIAFFAGGALKRLDLGAGTPVILAAAPAARGGTWNADGIILFAPLGDCPLMRVAATGGNPEAATGPSLRRCGWPHFLPDGRRFLFWASAVPRAEVSDVEQGIYLGTLDGGAPTLVTPAESSGAFLTSGWLLWVRAGALVAQRLDLEGAALIGDLVTLATTVSAQTNRSAISVASTGEVAYRSGARPQQLTWVDRSGSTVGTLGRPEPAMSVPRVSPGGSRVSVNRPGEGGGDLDVWLIDRARASRLTFGPATDSSAVWSPDAASIVFRSNRTGTFDLYRMPADGEAQEERLVASDQNKRPNDWSPDGRFVMYTSVDPQTKEDLWVVPVTGNHTPSEVLATPFSESWGAFSPDGLWVAYESDESGQLEVYIRPFVPPGAATAGGGRKLVSTSGGIWPVWSPEGAELYYLSPAGEMMAVSMTASMGALEPGAPTVLFRTSLLDGRAFPGPNGARRYDIAPDGRFLLLNEVAGDDAGAPITLVQHWRPPSY